MDSTSAREACCIPPLSGVSRRAESARNTVSAVRWALPAPPRGRETSTQGDPGLPSRKIVGQRPVDDGRRTFPGAVRFPLHSVAIALLDMVGLPGPLAVWGLLLLG